MMIIMVIMIMVIILSNNYYDNNDITLSYSHRLNLIFAAKMYPVYLIHIKPHGYKLLLHLIYLGLKMMPYDIPASRNVIV